MYHIRSNSIVYSGRGRSLSTVKQRAKKEALEVVIFYKRGAF